MFNQLRPPITDGLTGVPVLEAAGGLRLKSVERKGDRQTAPPQSYSKRLL